MYFFISHKNYNDRIPYTNNCDSIRQPPPPSYFSLCLEHFYWYSRLMAGSGVVDLWPAPISIMLIASLTNGSSENIIKRYIYIVSVVGLIVMHLENYSILH